MTDQEKDKIFFEIDALTKTYFEELRHLLEDNKLVYWADKVSASMNATPFGGNMPKVDQDMLEDLCLDIMNHDDLVKESLLDEEYIMKKVKEHEEYNSPVNRIKRHLLEVERLMDKYHVKEEDLDDTKGNQQLHR